MVPEEFQREVHAAMEKMGKKLESVGYIEKYSTGEIPGQGAFKLTDQGLVFANSLYKIFGDIANKPHELNGIEVVTVVQLILASRPASNN